TQVFERDPVVACDQALNELVQDVLPPIGDPLVLALKRQNSFSAVPPAVLATGDAALQHAQLPLFYLIPARVVYLLAIAGGEQPGNADINPHVALSRCSRLLVHDARSGRPTPCAWPRNLFELRCIARRSRSIHCLLSPQNTSASTARAAA